MPTHDPSIYPWHVVDTYGEHPPIGCWTEAAARRLPSQIGLRMDPVSRYQARPNPEMENADG